ncbi:MAG: CvpA family protein [Candidatus Fonsibacter sp.]|nr:CvpA family protein [Candidatus Fonsibacter sp.]
MDSFLNFFSSNKINIFDIIVGLIIIFNLISSTKKGFVLSLISFLKWVIAFIIAKFSIPYVLPFVSKIIENESTARTIAGITVFLLSLFLIIVIGKAMGKSLKWVGLGGIDKLFGFLFGGITGYFYCVIMLSLSNYIYMYDNWPAYLKNGSSYNSIEYGRKLFDEKILFSNEYIDETKKKLKK